MLRVLVLRELLLKYIQVVVLPCVKEILDRVAAHVCMEWPFVGGVAFTNVTLHNLIGHSVDLCIVDLLKTMFAW